MSIRRFLAQHSPLFILAALCIVLAILSPEFRQPDNLQKVALRTSEIAIMAIGQMLVILTAGIDLSVGSVAALAGIVTGIAVRDWQLPALLAICAGAGVGLLCGLTNGILITKGRIPPFIVTLGMMMAARGFAIILANSLPISVPAPVRWLGGSQRIGEYTTWWIPVSIILLLTILFAVILQFTRFGRAIYATGGNLTGARLSGIAVDRVRVYAYTLSGLLAGFAGIMLGARISIFDPTAAATYELEAIAACVIGGASLMGGEGGVVGALAGGLIMQVLVNFCNLNDISVYWQHVLVGGIIIALVYYDNVRKRRAGLLKE